MTTTLLLRRKRTATLHKTRILASGPLQHGAHPGAQGYQFPYQGNTASSFRNDADLVERLRGDGQALNSLAAEVQGGMVGHIMPASRHAQAALGLRAW